MGSSYIDYRGHGFWATDATIEMWLQCLLDETRAQPAGPGWLTQARDHWHIQATEGFQGCIDVGLERHLERDADREAVFLAILHRLDSRLAAQHLPASGERLPDADSDSDAIPAILNNQRLLQETTAAMISLVRGVPVAGQWVPRPPA
jgi:hypothetical protein